ncbi:MAG: esterase-like activity of phytase family protein, partial [bacterium]|nr:esterase-like activity of phytase family protein [Candidatus Colisoma equi]
MASKGVLLLGALALAGCSTVSVEHLDVESPRTVEDVCEFDRDPDPEGLSGIAHIGGNRYFSVDDRGGLLHELEIVQDEEGDVKSCKVVRSVRLEGRIDLEGCASDPLDGLVWVSDEHDTTIRQFDPETGRETARAAVPEVFGKNIRGNRSFEGLTISPDGFRMYVANEDTLACDGKPADDLRG